MSYHVLYEGKQVGVLYHFTKMHALKYILKSDSLRAGVRSHRAQSGIESEFVSFTRDYNLQHFHGGVWGTARLAVDGNKLSHRYKVIPYNDFWDEIQTLRKYAKADGQDPDVVEKKWYAMHGIDPGTPLRLTKFAQAETAVIIGPRNDYEHQVLPDLHRYVFQIDTLYENYLKDRPDTQDERREYKELVEGYCRRHDIKLNMGVDNYRPARP